MLRWGARLLAGALSLVLITAGVVYGISERRIRDRFTVPDHAIAVLDDAAAVARGRHLAVTRGCVECHGTNLGGRVMLEDPAHVEAEPTARYGAYLAAGCTGCHGPGDSGGKIPGTPPDWKPAANITPAGIGHYTEADFIRALREGRRPNGAPIDSLMPWRLTREMTDVELRALYAYLRTVPARPYGNR